MDGDAVSCWLQRHTLDVKSAPTDLNSSDEGDVEDIYDAGAPPIAAMGPGENADGRGAITIL